MRGAARDVRDISSKFIVRLDILSPLWDGVQFIVSAGGTG
jgi:hypothetical protein